MNKLSELKNIIYVIAYNGFDYDADYFVDEIISEYGFFDNKEDAEFFANQLNIVVDESTRFQNSENECSGYYVCQLKKHTTKK